MPDSTHGVNPNQTAINAAGSNVDSVPSQNTPTPSSLPAAPSVDNAGQPVPTVPPITAPTQVGPVVAAGQKMGGQPPMSTARKILQAATGGQTTYFVQNDNGPTPVKRDLTGGELARRILASVGSVFAAGAGGALAAKQHRKFELAPGTTLGDIQQEPIDKRQAEAQKEFENKQQVSQLTLQQHRAAQEQQESVARLRQYSDAHNAWVQAHANDALENDAKVKEINDRMHDIDIKNEVEYNKYLAMPGSQVMKDANENDLNFSDGREAQAYVLKHPEALHGSTDGKSKYGVVAAINPWTGRYQLIDYPADRYDVGITNFGQKKDKNGEPMFDKDNNPIPDGTVLDPKTKKPTVLTQTVTPDQARAIAAQNITLSDVQAQRADREAQARKYDAAAKKDSEIDDAKVLYESGRISQMSPRQKNVYATMIGKQERDAEMRLRDAESNLAKINIQGTPEEIKKSQQEADDAKDDYTNLRETFNNLMGNTPGILKANAIINSGTLNTTPWPEIDKQINAAPIADNEKEAMRGKLWNSLSPAQQDAAKKWTAAQAAKNNTAAPAPNTHVFDLNAWIAKNPNGDKAAAIKAAQDKGYTVKQ